MSIHFHRLTIREIKKETNECVSVLFEIPESLQKNFLFRHGQSLTMRTTLNKEEVRRTYSLCSSPLDHEWRVAIKKVDGGIFSCFANDVLKKGDVLEVMEPVGNFNTELDPSNHKKYLAIAAGSGITPVLSIIKTTLHTEPHSEFTLVYNNRSRASIIFFEELEALKNKFIDRFNLINVLSRERTDSTLNFGRVNKEKLIELEKLIDYKEFDDTFICGPEEMIFGVRDFLLEKGIAEKKIHFELFTSSSPARTKPREKSPVDDSKKSTITVKVDGRTFDMQIPLNSDLTILDAALQQGADLPYACKGGMCCTCKAKLLEGQVDMDVHWGLEEEEIDKGFILTCQSHPRTEKVVVDFDIK